MTKPRKIRSDILIGNLEKRLGLDAGAIRNPDGSDARSNKKLETLRNEYSAAKGVKIKTNPKISSKAIAKASKAVSSLSRIDAPLLKKVLNTKVKSVGKKNVIANQSRSKGSSTDDETNSSKSLKKRTTTNSKSVIPKKK